MAKMKRLLCLLLALVSLMSIVPMFAAAADDDEELTTTITIKKKIPSQKTTKYTVKVGEDDVKLTYERYITINKIVYEFSHFAVGTEKYDALTVPGYDGTKSWTKEWGKTIELVYKRHYHESKKAHDRVYHWDTCECGFVGTKDRHVDPTTVPDKVCHCGYQFSSNANLTTLWLANMTLSPNFNKDITEYTGSLRTYLDVTSTTITAFTFDALATVELPTNLEIREGVNKFQVKVTAEDKAATKIYTVTAVKPVKVENVQIAADGEKLAVTPKVTITKQLTGVSSLSEAEEAKLVEMMGTEPAKQVLFTPEYSKWSTRQGEITLTGKLLKAIADKKTLDLAVLTPYGSTLTIPASELTALAEKDSITIRIGRDHTCAILSGEEVLPLTDKITFVLPQ